jgi:hypothetical protein
MKKIYFKWFILGLLVTYTTPGRAMRVKQVMVWPMGSTLTLYQSARQAVDLTTAGLRSLGYQMVDSRQQGSFVNPTPVKDLARQARLLQADAVILVEVTKVEPMQVPCEATYPRAIRGGMAYRVYRWRDAWGRLHEVLIPVQRRVLLNAQEPAQDNCGRGYRVEVKLSLINAYTDHLAWSKSAEGWDAGHDEAYTIARQLNELIPKLNKYLNELPA